MTERAHPTVASYASSVAPYAPSRLPDSDGALVTSVLPESPADDIGIVPGMRITHVNGKPLTDMIVWLWEMDGESAELTVYDPRDGVTETAAIERFAGEDWGVDFDGAVFDGMRTCVNACLFCFMNMLPKESRSSLSIRDDDYRLSFLQGNFVTLTNMSDREVRDVIEKMLSPMNVSLHAVSPDVRRRLIGRNAARGMEVLERLLDAGIEVHAQIVLCPGLNDGDELRATLDYVEAHPGITSLAIVPLGFTKHQSRFTSSYSDDVEASRAVVGLIAPYQERARRTRGHTVFQLGDEFYVDADMEVPPAETYDGFPQFYDGIGMLRSFIDDVERLRSECAGELEEVHAALLEGRTDALLVCGRAARGVFQRFCGALGGDVVSPSPIDNRYFGGNVNVTGLTCACDLLEQLSPDLSAKLVVLPDVMFNYDGVTLDGVRRDDIVRELESRGGSVAVSTPAPRQLLDALRRASL
ncbi:MAG: DUF512 domain-containing protein [Collinsella sp.]|nr:DUF512 domain-containing protein [Collinsella sp.]